MKKPNRFRFRAWDSQPRRMLSQHELNYSLLFVAGDTGLSYYNPVKDVLSKNDNLILMQSTGLADKNGEEIFEGDIVELEHYRYDVVTGHHEYKNNRVVEWGRGGWKIGKYVLDSNRAEDVLVIGNIYANPELLK